MKDTRSHSPDASPRSTLADSRFGKVLQALEEHHCKDDLDRLLKSEADRDGLLQRLAAFASYSPKIELRRLTKRKTLAYAADIRHVAGLIESLNNRPDPISLTETIRVSREVAPPDCHLPPEKTEFSYREILAWPKALREYADRVESLPQRVQVRWEPAKVAAISQIVWYVKQKTGSEHDAEVSKWRSALSDVWTPDADELKQWRQRYENEINIFGSLEVLPMLPHRPRKR